jgi:cytochrome c556
LLREAFREAIRTAPVDRFDDRFRQWLADAEAQAAQFEADLRGPNLEGLGARVDLLDRSCNRCHAGYRN